MDKIQTAAITIERQPLGWSCTIINPASRMVIAYGFARADTLGEQLSKRTAVARATAQLTL